MYIGPFRNAINVGSDDSYFNIQVGEALIRAWRDWKSGGSRITNEVTYKLTQNIKNIFGFDSLELNATPDDRSLQLFVNGRSYTLPEVSAGISQFFMVLASAAVRNPTYILIDEPELNLHPSLQLDFLTTLGSYAQEGVFFATHSIGLARAAANRVYSVRWTGDVSEVSKYERTSRLSAFLGELSFSGNQELGFDRILLVEGPTEVQTIQHFLRSFGKDHQIVLLPLGGASLINAKVEQQLQEIKRISANISALIDSERSSSDEVLAPDRQGFVEACARAQVQCHVLDRRATENYFTDRVVKRVMGQKYSNLGEFGHLKSTTLGWSKADNWKMAREMTLGEWEGTDCSEPLKSDRLRP